MDKKNNNGWIIFLSSILSFCFLIGILLLQLQIRNIRQKQQTMIEMENIQFQKEEKDEKQMLYENSIVGTENSTIEMTQTKVASSPCPSSTKKIKLESTTAVYDTINKITKEAETTKVNQTKKHSETSKNIDKTTTKTKIEITTEIIVETTTETTETTETPSSSMPVVLVVNLKTKKIHSASCPLLKNQNTDYITEILSTDLEDYLFEGYTLCSKCKGDIYAQ